MLEISEICEHCNCSIDLTNPSGYCCHLYYPDCCDVCKSKRPKTESELLKEENQKLKEKIKQLEEKK